MERKISVESVIHWDRDPSSVPSIELGPAIFMRTRAGDRLRGPSPYPFYNLLAAVCVLRILIALSLTPLRKPVVGREMDSMIVEGRGHPSVFFSILEEGFRVRPQGFPQQNLPV